MKDKALTAIDLLVVAVMIVGILPFVMVIFPFEWLLDAARSHFVKARVPLAAHPLLARGLHPVHARSSKSVRHWHIGLGGGF